MLYIQDAFLEETLQNELPLEAAIPGSEEEYDNEQTQKNILSNLGFHVLPDRRIRFGGKTLQGVTLPKSTSSQISIIKRLLNRYGPCLKAQKNGYQLNQDCFAKRENEFLKLLAKNLSNLRFKYIL